MNRSVRACRAYASDRIDMPPGGRRVAVDDLVRVRHGGSGMDRSLYERLGGSGAIVAVIEDFVARAANDPRINAKFARTDVPRLKAMLVDQVTAAAGGAAAYTGRGMDETQAGMGVTAGEFDALVGDLVATLNQFEVPAPEQTELLAILGPLRADMVEVETSATGTPLPDAYRNAPPLA